MLDVTIVRPRTTQMIQLIPNRCFIVWIGMQFLEKHSERTKSVHTVGACHQATVSKVTGTIKRSQHVFTPVQVVTSRLSWILCTLCSPQLQLLGWSQLQSP